MENVPTLHDTVCEALGQALVRLMERKPFSQITITEIVQVAGVGRSSFYRNYREKEELLCEYIHTLYMDYFRREQVPPQLTSPEEAEAFLLPRFRFIRQHSTLFRVLSEHNMMYPFFRRAKSDLVSLLCGQELSPYHRAMCAGACAGIIQCWAENNFRESEEEMTSLFFHSTRRHMG
ncbi:MAG: TetR/AcrR family transcriptional regulator [Clostridia bacterium]|nr:TetR/AcrR family transcriptional regulator [Clostridia bacterium]